MTEFRTHYDNLQISRSASLEVIKAAYRILSAKHHPDRNGGDSRSVEIMSILNNSYAVLSDKDARRQHDVWIKQQEAARSRRPSAGFRSGEAAGLFQDPSLGTGRLGFECQAVGRRRESIRCDGSCACSGTPRKGHGFDRRGRRRLHVGLRLALGTRVGVPTGGEGACIRSSPSVGTAAAREDASDPIVWVSTRRDEAPERAIHVATAFAKSESLLDARAYTARIHDDGDAWLVSYRSPAERRAAAPIVLIDKESMRVIGYYAGDR